ncbi:MAG: serine/threonine protein kinase [Actinomycetia bacterium]|nr:serine/threonine protein kinase [Actinomycetes bacterium]
MTLTGESGQAEGLEQPEGSPVPMAGPASLGAELRRLRKAHGLTQRTLAQRLGYSAHSAIADYEAGRRVPASDVLIGYEGLFRLSAGSLQRQRAAVIARLAEEQFRAQADVVVAGQVPAAEPEQSSAGNPAPPRDPRWRRWVPRRHVIILGLASVVLAMAVGGWAMTRGDGSGPALDPTWRQSNQHVTDNAERTGGPEDMDGDDPRARDCVFDAVVRDTVPLLLPGGKPFGVLRLRYSAHCGASWGSALYRNPQMYMVQITATRPADGAEARSQWSNNTPPGSYGDMLSTAVGCVRVSAVVITPRGTGPTAVTPCLK